MAKQARRTAPLELPEISIPDVPRAFMSWRSSIVGIEAESLDSQLAEYFGVKEGVLVRSVVRGSSAEKAGLAGRRCHREGGRYACHQPARDLGQHPFFPGEESRRRSK